MAYVEQKDVYDIPDVISLLNAAKREYGPEWVDPNALKKDEGCKNVYYDGESGKTRHCIVGWVFNAVVSDDINIPPHGSARSVCMHHPKIGQRFTEEAIEVLAYAQELQDMKTPWGAVCLAVDSHYLVERSNAR